MLSRLALHAGGSKSPHGPWPWAGTQQPESPQQGLASQLVPDRARWLSKNQLTQLQKPRNRQLSGPALLTSGLNKASPPCVSLLQILPMKAQGSTPGFKSVEKSNSHQNPRPASLRPRLGRAREADPTCEQTDAIC